MLETVGSGTTVVNCVTKPLVSTWFAVGLFTVPRLLLRTLDMESPVVVAESKLVVAPPPKLRTSSNKLPRVGL